MRENDDDHQSRFLEASLVRKRTASLKISSDLFTFKSIKKALRLRDLSIVCKNIETAISKAHYILSILYIIIAVSGTLNLENLLLYLIMFKGCKFSEYALV